MNRQTVLTEHPLLRCALLAEAALALGLGIALIEGGAGLAPVLALPAALLRWAGASLVPFAAFVLWAALAPSPSRPAIGAIVAWNTAWALEGFVSLACGWIAPSPAGLALMMALAGLIGLLVHIQARGLLHLRDSR